MPKAAEMEVEMGRPKGVVVDSARFTKPDSPPLGVGWPFFAAS